MNRFFVFIVLLTFFRSGFCSWSEGGAKEFLLDDKHQQGFEKKQDIFFKDPSFKDRVLFNVYPDEDLRAEIKELKELNKDTERALYYSGRAMDNQAQAISALLGFGVMWTGIVIVCGAMYLAFDFCSRVKKRYIGTKCRYLEKSLKSKVKRKKLLETF